MSKIIQKRKNKKRTLWALLLLLISIVIIIGCAFALLSDTTVALFTGKAGTLKLEIKEQSKTMVQYYTKNGTEYSDVHEGHINNLNPGDIIDTGFTVINKGNKSAVVRTILTFKVIGTDIPEDILNNLYIIPYDVDNLLTQRTAIRGGALDEAIELVLDEEASTSGIQVYKYVVDQAGIQILNGGIDFPNREIELNGVDEFLARYLIYFDFNAGNEYQKINIEINIKVEAMQYRNNTEENWGFVDEEDISIGDKLIPTLTYNYDSWTNNNVLVTLTFNKPATITNNGGNNTFLFTDNGSFAFNWSDSLRKFWN